MLGTNATSLPLLPPTPPLKSLPLPYKSKLDFAPRGGARVPLHDSEMVGPGVLIPLDRPSSETSITPASHQHHTSITPASQAPPATSITKDQHAILRHGIPFYAWTSSMRCDEYEARLTHFAPFFPPKKCWERENPTSFTLNSVHTAAWTPTQLARPCPFQPFTFDRPDGLCVQGLVGGFRESNQTKCWPCPACCLHCPASRKPARFAGCRWPLPTISSMKTWGPAHQEAPACKKLSHRRRKSLRRCVGKAKVKDPSLFLTFLCQSSLGVTLLGRASPEWRCQRTEEEWAPQGGPCVSRWAFPKEAY